MSDSLLSPTSSQKATRLDAPHNLMSSMTADEHPVPWMALAGRDPEATPEQLDRQTSELLVYVQQQNEQLDARQAELNAKLARLDNELRNARLRSGLEQGADLTEKMDALEQAMSLTTKANDPSAAIGDEQVPSAMPACEAPITKEPPVQAEPTSEFDEVQQLIAGIIERPAGKEESPTEMAASRATAAEAPTKHPAAAKSPERPDITSSKDPQIVAPVSTLESFPHLLPDSHLGRATSRLQTEGEPLESSDLDVERRLLAERKLELERNKAVLQRMHQETQALHKESLEMRFVTEQLWAELSDQVPAAQIKELLDSLRARLHEHYHEQEKAAEQRKSELSAIQKTVEQKQDEVRQRSRQLQEWVESRHDEVKAYAAELEARELSLEQREHEFRAERSQWEAQRSACQQQIEALMQQLNQS